MPIDIEIKNNEKYNTIYKTGSKAREVFDEEVNIYIRTNGGISLLNKKWKWNVKIKK